jgi:signal transduction histidine kinase
LSGKGGLGIGLALVRQLVERQAGRIEVSQKDWAKVRPSASGCRASITP